MFDKLIPIMIICFASLFYGTSTDTFFKVVLVILVVYILYEGSINFDIGDLFLVLGTFIYYLFLDKGINDALYNSIIYGVVYQIGKKFAMVGGYTPENKCMCITILISVERMTRGFLNYIKKPEGSSVWYDSEGTMFLSTRFEADLVMMAALLGFFVVLVFLKRSKLGIAGIMMSLACIYMGVDLGGRFALGCCICGSLAVLLLFIIEHGLYKNRCGRMIILFFGIICIFLVFVYTFDLFGYRKIYSAYFSGSGGFFTNTRFSLMAQQLRLFREYPLGKCEVPLVQYNGAYMYDAHNYWIDIGRRAGVIPAVLYVSFSINNIIDLFKVWKHSSSVVKYGLIAAFVGIMMYTALEVITFSWIWRTIVLMGGFFRGIVSDICDRHQDERKSAYRVGFSL